MLTEPTEIVVCFTQAGTAAHGLHLDCRTAHRPWVTFTSAGALENALRYLGGTEEQLEVHRRQMARCGQGSSNIRLLPDWKNLLRIDYSKL
jgi:uncharacterized protein (DUF2126 family)